MNIIWSCLSILLICSYKCIHFDIPSREEAEAGFFSRDKLRKYLRKAKWVVIILIAPEIGIAWAYEEFSRARKALQFYKSNLPPDLQADDPFTMAHAYYFRMAGVRLLQGNSAEGQQITLYDYSRLVTTSPMGCDRFPLSENDILALSKSDALTKVIAGIQTSWLVLQSIARLCNSLPLTALEVTTMAYIVCAATIYGLWWKKPYDAEHVTFLRRTSDLAYVTIRSDTSRGELFDDAAPIFKFHQYMIHPPNKANTNLGPFLIYGSATTFGAVHVAAWSLDFPSAMDLILWRVFSLTSMVLPLCFSAYTSFLPSLEALDTLPDFLYYGGFGIKTWHAPVYWLLIGMYFVSRLGITALTWYQLSSLSPKAYEAVYWTSFLFSFS